MEPKEVEEKAIKFWEKEKIYSFDKKSGKKPYSIDTPPPTVSGNMHMGHAFMYSQMDFIARYKRMNGFNVFYPFGTDDNGLPTEKLIEKIKNVRSKDMLREEFINLCLKTLKEILPPFIQDWKKLGISCDYDKIYSTIDDNSRKISQKYFLDAYKKRLVYKKDFPTIWDTTFQTAVAQAELEDKEQETLFSTLKFKIKDSKEELLIATTRPELLGACLAVFINPNDKKNKKLLGKKAIVPLFNQEVPILEDKSADMEKGTGILMVCSYGDKYDVDAIIRHKLTPKVIIEKNGTLNIEPYMGLSIKKAREKILEELKNKGLIKEQKKIIHSVNVYEKSGTEIEFIPTSQWFVKILEFKKDFISQAKKINWLPENMIKRYENWVNGLDWDWIISRDRHFGVPIPIWYCEECREVILANEPELPVDPINTNKKCAKCKKNATPETKVLDTWATSSLTPQIASNLYENKIKIPYSLRPQGHDIIRTWAFYTIVRSLLQEKEIPWKNIFITGNVLLKGEKMSKSKGNVVSPQEVLERYGADALRYSAASTKLGDDIEYQENDVIAGKRLFNKLSNAARFVFMNLKKKPKKPKKIEKVDDLFLDELNNVVSTSTIRFEDYNYSRAKFNVDEFFWKNFCDKYLEIVKWRVYKGDKEEKESAFYTLYNSLLTILKLLAPVMPFITEEIYQAYFKKYEKDKSIHISNWPETDKKRVEKLWKDKSYYELGLIIDKIRQEKTKAQKSMNSEIILTLTKEDFSKIKELEKDLKHVSNAKEIKEGNEFKVEFL